MSKDKQEVNLTRWDKLVVQARQVKRDTATIVKNVFELVEALSLVTTSMYAMWAAYYSYKLKTVFDILLFAAGFVILLMGVSLLVKHLNKRS